MWESLAYMTWCFIFLIFLSICRSCNFSLSKCFVFWVYAGLRDLRFTKPAYTQKNQHFDAKSAKNLHILKKSKVLIVKSHQTCIYSKISKVLIVKSHQTCIYSKNQKNQKSQTLCGTHWHRWLGFCFSWFFWVYAGLVTFHYQNFCFFLSICRFGDFSLSKCLTFLSICRFEGLEVHQTCIYSKKATFWCQKCTKPAYTQKYQKFW